MFIITIIVFMYDLYDHKFYNGNVEEKHKETFKNYFEKYKNLIVILFILLTIIVWIININNPLLY